MEAMGKEPEVLADEALTVEGSLSGRPTLTNEVLLRKPPSTLFLTPDHSFLWGFRLSLLLLS